MQWDGIHALLQRVKAGDEAAWQRLHAMALPYLLRLVQRYLGPDWPQQSISDLIQDTWIRAWQGIEGFDGGADDDQTAPMFRAWLGQIMKRVWQNNHRHDQAQVRRPPPGTVYLGTPAPEDSSAGLGALDLPAADPTPSQNVRQAERNGPGFSRPCWGFPTPRTARSFAFISSRAGRCGRSRSTCTLVTTSCGRASTTSWGDSGASWRNSDDLLG